MNTTYGSKVPTSTYGVKGYGMNIDQTTACYGQGNLYNYQYPGMLNITNYAMATSFFSSPFLNGLNLGS